MFRLWHGTTDTTLSYHHFGEELKQWTNVQGISQTPVSTDFPVSSWTRTRYGSNTTQAPVEGISIANTGHTLPQNGMAAYGIRFLGLDQATTTTTPTTTTQTTTSVTTTTTGAGGAGDCTATLVPPDVRPGGFVSNVNVTARPVTERLAGNPHPALRSNDHQRLERESQRVDRHRHRQQRQLQRDSRRRAVHPVRLPGNGFADRHHRQLFRFLS